MAYDNVRIVMGCFRMKKPPKYIRFMENLMPYNMAIWEWDNEQQYRKYGIYM